MRTHPRSRPKWLVPVLGVAAVAAVVGASNAGKPRTESAAEACAVTRPATTSGDQLLVLVDRSGSGDSAKRRAEQAEDVRWVVSEAVNEGVDSFSVGYFDGSTASIAWNRCLDQVPLIPEGNNSTTRERRAPDLIDAVTQEALAPLSQRGGTGTDIMGAINEAAQKSDPSTGSVRIVALTDGVGTAGCSRVDHLKQRSRQTIEANVARCSEAYGGQVAGRKVSIIGVGRTSDVLSSEEVVWLVELNRRSCEAIGAEGCNVSTYRGSGL